MFLTREQARDIDRKATELYGIPSIVMMENAGRGCAELLMSLNSERKNTVIFCGPGNNGGDGYVIARHLALHGWPCEIRTMGEHPGMPADARTNLAIARKLGLKIATKPTIIPEDAWIVDALFGTGLNRPIWTPFVEIVEEINQYRNRVFAVDIPSGLDCDTGEPLGPTVKADFTATFVDHKVGFQNPACREFVGTIFTVPIGFVCPRGG